MSYPKYDKEEAKRVYDESVAKHGGNDIDHVSSLLIALAVAALVSLVFVFMSGKSKEKHVVIEEHVGRVINISLDRRGKYDSFFSVVMQDVDSKQLDTIGTRTIYYGVNDTVKYKIKIER
jgi:hypothetical protein